LNFLLDIPTDTDKDGKQLLSILDFGGQCAYYACHQVYLSRRAFYLLVLNMAKGFDEKVDPSICEQAGTMFADWTYGGESNFTPLYYYVPFEEGGAYCFAAVCLLVGRSVGTPAVSVHFLPTSCRY
jgi:hypothetical protein